MLGIVGGRGSSEELGGIDERDSPSPVVTEVRHVAKSALEQLGLNTPSLTNEITVIEVEDEFYDALAGEEEGAVEKLTQKTPTPVAFATKDVAIKIYNYVGNALVAVYNLGASVSNKLHPKARKAETKTDHTVDKIAREALPKSLPKIILNALDFIELKGFMARHTTTKGIYETVSLFALEFVLNKTHDVVTIGLDRFAKSVEAIVNKSIEQKNNILKLAEALVLNNTTKTLASMNEVYAKNKGLENKSQAEQTFAVLSHLKAKGELHEAVALLSLEEEQLWAVRDSYLVPGQTVHDRILVLSADKEANAKEIEDLYKLKAIEMKVSAAEYAYLTKLGDEIFEKILYPNNSFKSELPIYLRPFAGWIKGNVLLGLSATLSAAISSATDPAKIVQMVIEDHQKKQVLANLNQYLLTHESVDTAIERFEKDPIGNRIVLMALKDLKAAAEKKVDVVVSGGDNALTGAVLHNLAKEVSRIGFSGSTEAVDVVEFYGNAAHTVASGAMGVLEWGFSCLENTGLFGSYAGSAKETVQTYKKTWDNQQNPNTLIDNMIGNQVAGLHQMGLNAFNQDGLDGALSLLPDLIVGAAADQVISDEHPAALVERSQLAKTNAKEILKQNLEIQLGPEVGKTIASGVDPLLDRFTNKRLNSAITYNALDGAIEAIRVASGDKK